MAHAAGTLVAMMNFSSRRGSQISTLGLVLAMLLPLFFACQAWASVPDGDEPLTIDRIYGSGEFSAQGFGPVRWLEDGGYTALERDDDGQPILARYEPETGERTVLVPAARLTPDGSERALSVADYQWSADGEKLLVFTNTRRVWRRHSRGDYWVVDLSAGTLRKMGGDLEETWLQFAKFSPDGDAIAFVHQNDLYRQNLPNGAPVALTTDGSATLINGTFDWVYEEEWSLRDGFRWSPDGDRIAFWQIDDEGVEQFPLVDLTSGLYPELKWIHYPKAGTTNPKCRVGVIELARGPANSEDGSPGAITGNSPVRWVELPGDLRDDYVARMEWTPDGHLLIQQVNRRQDTVSVLDVDPSGWSPSPVFRDHDPAWADVCDDVVWLDDQGRAFTWVSERGGWRQVWIIDRDGVAPRCLTSTAQDVISVLKVDPKNDALWFLASPENATQRYLYRQSLSGGEPVRVTPSDQPGSHDYQISDDGRFAIHRWSSKSQVPQVELVRLPSHEPVDRFSTVRNESLAARIDELPPVREEFFQLELPDGVVVDGWMMFPPDFDPEAGKWPLLMHVYGEPAGTTVNDSWGSASQLWHRLLAQEGYVVASIDNRGTPAPKGRAWRKSVYGEIGVLAASDQAEAVLGLIAAHPWIDTERIGIWGWSGGGSMTLNALFRYPEIYSAGIAVAFVADQRYYDTIYQERFMNTPQANPEGYRAGSPIHHAAGLEDPVLLVYGTGDDNCHYQNFEAMVNELVKHGKQFDQLAYPNRSHGIHEGAGTSLHLRRSMLRWWRRNLPPGPTVVE
ncbi:MAG: S9 family peptidase [Phycisphaerales bacterium]|nr:S9 family peptidase [Phycisphaerales bacterium]